MNAILLKFWTFLKQKNNMLIAIVIAIILFLSLVDYFQHKKIVGLKDKYDTEVKLKNALLDTVHVYKNKQGEMVAEKLTIQETVKNLSKMYGQLTASQQELINRVKDINKKNDIIAAALIQTNINLDSLKGGKVSINEKDSSISFKDSTKNIKYNILISHAIPALKNIKPILTFNEFLLPNKQFIEFHWDKKAKTDYPVSFSVSNSNDYFKTVNIDSYAIPAINKDKINPSGWKKFTGWIGKNGKYVLIGGIGVAVGHYIIK
jgi:hypothetical protein